MGETAADLNKYLNKHLLEDPNHINIRVNFGQGIVLTSDEERELAIAAHAAMMDILDNRTE